MEMGATMGCEKIIALFDAGTFVETGAYVKRTDGSFSGVTCGYGAIGGKLVYAFAQNSDCKKGAFDRIQAEKIAALYGMAQKNGAPVVGLFDSAGAMVCDGASAMSAYGTFLKIVSEASGVIPQIAVITGVCSGMAATVASMFDVMVTVKGQSRLFVNAPFLIGSDVGSAEYAAATGLSSVSAEDDADAVRTVAKLIALLPSNNEEGTIEEDNADDANRTVSPVGLTGHALIGEIADVGSFVEFGNGYAKEVLTGIASFGGVSCGIVAGNGNENAGILTADGAKKAARLVAFCDSFSIPVVTLVDSEGLEVSKTAEGTPFAAQLGKLAMAYASADTAKITAVTGKAYGAAFTLFGSKALGADMVYALPNAEISVMNPASAVAFLWNDRINANTSRADLVDEWKKTCASPEAAAADGSIDDVIKPEELRQRICAAVNMLLAKGDGYGYRKHCNLPL